MTDPTSRDRIVSLAWKAGLAPGYAEKLANELLAAFPVLAAEATTDNIRKRAEKIAHEYAETGYNGYINVDGMLDEFEKAGLLAALAPEPAEREWERIARWSNWDGQVSDEPAVSPDEPKQVDPKDGE